MIHFGEKLLLTCEKNSVGK